MTSDEFVRAVERIARFGAVESTIENLNEPPGRAPDSDLLAMSTAYLKLSDEDKQLVKRIADLAAKHSVCELLSIIDGVAPLKSGVSSGRLELYFVDGATRTLLNDIDQEPLNDKLR